MIPDNIAVAASNCEINVVAEWLAAHPQSVNDVDYLGESLLLLCVNESYAETETNVDDQLELVRYLLSQGADPNSRGDSDDEINWTMTPLYAACGSDRETNQFFKAKLLVACLLGAGADPNLKYGGDAPLASVLTSFLGVTDGSWMLPVVAHLLRCGASLDNCAGNRSAEDLIAREEQQWPELVVGDLEFQAAAILIRGVRAVGSWKKYCRRWGPHREILRLRSLVVRGRGTMSDTWLAGMVRLKENGLVWKVLSFWRDPDDIEEVVLPPDEEWPEPYFVRVYEQKVL